MRVLVLFIWSALLARTALAAPVNSLAELPTTSRLAGAHEFNWNWAPFVVRVANGERFCTGSLIRQRWVLLAGHCKMAVGGTVFVNGGQRKVAVVHRHPDFAHGDFGLDNDVGLVKLDAPAPASALTTKLSRQAWSPKPGAIVELFGFGAKNEAREGPRILRRAFLTMIAAAKCKAMMPWPEWRSALDPIKQFCINEWKKESGICAGDSGGPLRVGHYQVAIASYRLGPCGSRIRPDVFARVQPYIGWIESVVGPLPH